MMLLFDNKGFTLIELIITLSILGIVISISLSSYQSLMASQALSQRADKVYYTLQLAKTEAIKRNKRVYVHFCQQGKEWKMGLSELTSCDCFSENACQLDGVDKVQDLVDGDRLFIKEGGLTFVGDQASYNALRFTVATGTVTLSNHYDEAVSIIQSAMRLRVCTPNKAQLGYAEC